MNLMRSFTCCISLFRCLFSLFKCRLLLLRSAILLTCWGLARCESFEAARLPPWRCSWSSRCSWRDGSLISVLPYEKERVLFRSIRPSVGGSICWGFVVRFVKRSPTVLRTAVIAPSISLVVSLVSQSPVSSGAPLMTSSTWMRGGRVQGLREEISSFFRQVRTMKYYETSMLWDFDIMNLIKIFY